MDHSISQISSTIDDRKEKFIHRLKTFISFKSVSEDVDCRLDVVRALRWIAARLKKLGADVVINRVGKQNVYCGDQIPLSKCDEIELPGVVLGTLGNDKLKQTVLIYGHVDVKEVTEQEKWIHDPFDMQIIDDYLCGRGVTDDKGPLLGWLNAIEAFQKTDIPIPVNIKFVIEGMAESGSQGIYELLNELSFTFFKDVDHVAMSDNYWLGQTTPCLTYGLRGIIYFYVIIQGPQRILHSGCHGGAVIEPLVDLIYLLSQLVDNHGRPLITGIDEDIQELNPEEIKRFKKLDFDPNTYQTEITAPGLHTDDKIDLLRRRWCSPSISVHGIEHTFDKPGAQTLIPNKVLGKFSVRIVPQQNPGKISQIVVDYLEKLHKSRGSPNELDIKVFRNVKPFLGNPKSSNCTSAYRAINRIWGNPPNLTRDGATIPMANALQEYTKRDVVLIPMGQSLDYQHEHNERLYIQNFMNGMKVFASYLFELALTEI